MEHTAPVWLVWLLGGAATVGGGIALAVLAREARIMRAQRALDALDGDDQC